MPKILLVEDNELNRDMLSRRLVKKGFEVALAVDAEEALAKAKAEQPDLILMDVELLPAPNRPRGPDGWEATRCLKALPETRSIPVIALTASAMAEHREKSFEAGCDDFDTKPVEMPRLLDKIRTLLQRQTAP
jgi:CheY-like chemotaxis protein